MSPFSQPFAKQKICDHLNYSCECLKGFHNLYKHISVLKNARNWTFFRQDR